MKIASNYYNDRLRECPSFTAWDRATKAFIAHNNADKTIAARLRFAMDRLSKIISDEFNSRAYQAGPVGQLP
jgi:hypothetical protein